MTNERSDPILEFSEEAVECVLKQYNLHSESNMNESIRILEAWIEKQKHFNMKNFRREFLESTIISSKGSIERAKTRLDKYCTLRTTMPRFFEKFDVKNDFDLMHKTYNVAVLPKSTKGLYRVLILKVNNKYLNVSTTLDFLKFAVIVGEYLKAHDYFHGVILIIDYLEIISLLDVVKSFYLVDIADAIKLYTEGYGTRLKCIHILSPSKLVEAVVSVFKQVLSSKLSGRIQVHKTVETLHDAIPKNVLPMEYGGEERPLLKLCDDWLKVLSSQEHQNYLREMKKADTDESCRPVDDISDKLGLTGTFRNINVD